MTRTLTVKKNIYFARGERSSRTLKSGSSPPAVPKGRVPRVARLMALAIRFDGLIRNGVVADQAELARLGHISRARLTQIMNLLNLAPDIQEAILFLPRVERGRDPVTERDVRPIVAVMDWGTQTGMWELLVGVFPTTPGQAASPKNRKTAARRLLPLAKPHHCSAPDCR